MRLEENFDQSVLNELVANLKAIKEPDITTEILETFLD